MEQWHAITWLVDRAAGMTSLVFLTLAVAVGLLLSMQWQSGQWPRIVNSEGHNFVALLALIFGVVHGVAAWLDPFTRFDWFEIFVPFTSHYRPLWMALGILGAYLGIAIGISAWLRPAIGYAWWRRLHVLTFGVWGLAIVHSMATGTDTRTWWGILLYGGSVLGIASLFWLRLLVPAKVGGKTYPLIAGGSAVLFAVGALWAGMGPFQAGWNNVANGGNGNGARGPFATPQTSNGAIEPISDVPLVYDGRMLIKVPNEGEGGARHAVGWRKAE